MSLHLPDIIARARDGSQVARRQLQSLQAQGVDLPASAVSLLNPSPSKAPVEPERRTGKESELQSAIVAYLQGLGWYVLVTFTGSKRGGSVWMHKGMPDLICLRSGRVLFLEVKRPEKDSRATPEQLETHEAIRQQGGTCEIVRSIMDVHELLIREGLL